MARKKYFLTADLIINGNKELVTLSNYDLIALEKYTAFCSGPEELLWFMPDNNNFSVKSYLSKYIKTPINLKEDPFSIRTSPSKKAKKIKIIYKKDADVLLATKDDLLSKLVKHFNLTLEDCVNDNIDKDVAQFLKLLYKKFAGRNFNRAYWNIIERNFNMDYTYDNRYIIVENNKWMLIGISKECARALIEDAYKDDRKRIELAFLLKEKTGDLMPLLDGLKKDELLTKLNDRLARIKASSFYVRNNIQNNVKNHAKTFNSNLNQPISQPLMDERRVNDDVGSTYASERMEYLRDKIETIELTLNSLIEEERKLKEGMINGSSESVLKKLQSIRELIKDNKDKLIYFKYELNELETGNISFSDAGFIIEKDKYI